MTPLTLRLARPYLLASIGLIAAVALYAVLTRRAMTANLDASALDTCLASGGNCQALARDFTDKFNVVVNSYRWIAFVPLLIGMFWAVRWSPGKSSRVLTASPGHSP